VRKLRPLAATSLAAVLVLYVATLVGLGAFGAAFDASTAPGAHRNPVGLVGTPPPPSSGSLTIVALSDLKARSGVLLEAYKEKADVFIVGGDLVEQNSEFEYRYANRLLGMAPRGVPTFLVFGNHESWDRESHASDERFTENFGPPQSWFLVKGVLFVSLDTADYDFTEERFERARAILDAHRSEASHIVLLTHILPLVGDTRLDKQGREKQLRKPDSDRIKALVDRYGIELVLGGHYHGHAETKVGNATYVITGGGGAALDGNGTEFYHYEKIAIGPSGVTPSFVKVASPHGIEWLAYKALRYRGNVREVLVGLGFLAIPLGLAILRRRRLRKLLATAGPPPAASGRPGLAAVLLVFALAAFAIFGALGSRSLENKDISRTAEIARETLEGGHWLAPRREGELETEKPPLYMWLVAATGAATGRIGALESRLPAAIASFATLLVVYFWVRKRRGATLALSAVAFLAVGQLFLELARLSRVDALFAFLVTVSVLLAHEAERTTLKRGLWLSVSSGVALALAMLAKSPLLALVLHLAAIGGFYGFDLAVEKPWQGKRAWLVCLKRYLAPPASVPPILACLLFAIWLVPFYRSITPEEWDRVWHQFMFENVERGLTGSDKKETILFYLPRLLGQAAPSSLLAILLLVPLRSLVSPDPEARRFQRFAQCWWLFPFIVLSVAQGKQARYLLPLLPGLAVAAAEAWELVATGRDRWTAHLERFLTWALVGVGGVAAVALPIAALLWASDMVVAAFCLAAGAAAVAVLAYRGAASSTGRGALVPLLLACFLAEVGFNVVYLPSPGYDGSHAPLKKLAQMIPASRHMGDIVIYQPPKQGNDGEQRQRKIRFLLSIYRDDPKVMVVATTPEEFLQKLDGPDKRGLVEEGYWQKDLRALQGSLEIELPMPVEIDRAPETFLLVRRRP
jgi:4-amino-4-deoxy-L-arabinose transferase-like glycosyltransferase/Icc-related predicted phosphoesterase